MRKTNWNVFILVSTLAFASASAQASLPQPPGMQSENHQEARNDSAPDSSVYRVSYKVNEVENGKTINSRSYTLMAKTRERASSRVGSRIPIASGPGPGAQYQYQDVGMNVDCIVTKHAGNLLVRTDIGLSTLQDSERSSTSMSPPVLRHFTLGDETVVTEGKPAFVGSIDDVASNQRYVIEVIVT